MQVKLKHLVKLLSQKKMLGGWLTNSGNKSWSKEILFKTGTRKTQQIVNRTVVEQDLNAKG
jgi:hypothetical protein